MLQIALAHSLLIQAQEDYRRLDTRWGALMASTISAARALLHAQSMAFNRRQRTRALVMPDGRVATAGSGARSLFARLLAEAVRRHPPRHLLSALARSAASAVPRGRRTFLGPGSAFYVAQMDIGPPQARKLGDVTLLVAYLDLVNRLYIVWAGALEDKEEALERLEERTSGLTDWTALDPEYQDLLLSRCR